VTVSLVASLASSGFGVRIARVRRHTRNINVTRSYYYAHYYYDSYNNNNVYDNILIVLFVFRLISTNTVLHSTGLCSKRIRVVVFFAIYNLFVFVFTINELIEKRQIDRVYRARAIRTCQTNNNTYILSCSTHGTRYANRYFTRTHVFRVFIPLRLFLF